LLADEGIIVCEHATEDTFEYANFEVFDEKRYGNIMLTYLSNKE
jgi:16S rRNA G966 N2-methylase RsmD